MTLIVFGLPRFNCPLEPVLMLVTIRYVLLFITWAARPFLTPRCQRWLSPERASDQ